MTAPAHGAQLVYAVLAAVLADDRDGLDALMSPLDRNELDFLVTGLCSVLAGFLASAVGRTEALRIVREAALGAAREEE
jgi:hypothetical protein